MKDYTCAIATYELYKGLLEYWWISYIRAVYYVYGTPLQIFGNASGIWNLFMRLGLAVLRKHLTGDYRRMFSGDGFVLYV